MAGNNPKKQLQNSKNSISEVELMPQNSDTGHLINQTIVQILVEKDLDYRTGVVYTTNRRVWEHDAAFKEYLREIRAIGIDMETATIFIIKIVAFHSPGISKNLHPVFFG